LILLEAVVRRDKTFLTHQHFNIETYGIYFLLVLREDYILTLALYEIGNVLWKEATLLNRISLKIW